MLKEKTLSHLSDFLIEEIHKQKEIGLIDKMWHLVDIASGNYCGSSIIKNDETFALAFTEDVAKTFNECIFKNSKEELEAVQIIKELNSELEKK